MFNEKGTCNNSRNMLTKGSALYKTERESSSAQQHHRWEKKKKENVTRAFCQYLKVRQVGLTWWSRNSRDHYVKNLYILKVLGNPLRYKLAWAKNRKVSVFEPPAAVAVNKRLLAAHLPTALSNGNFKSNAIKLPRDGKLGAHQVTTQQGDGRV